jgi:hypothetical protein
MARGLMVMLDVVYNHFGPEGNYLHAYACQFFTERRHTDWGAAINFDGAGARTVRDFFIHNALYWLEEFHFDGLRFDAVHAIIDDSTPHILVELAQEVRSGPGAQREMHLVYASDTATKLARCLTEGFAYQGEPYSVISDSTLQAVWQLGDGSLSTVLNFSSQKRTAEAVPRGELLHCEPASAAIAFNSGELPPNAVAVYLSRADSAH